MARYQWWKHRNNSGPSLVVFDEFTSRVDSSYLTVDASSIITTSSLVESGDVMFSGSNVEDALLSLQERISALEGRAQDGEVQMVQAS